MNAISPLPLELLKRKAVVYVRQSSQSQVMQNLESQRRQYDLVDAARQHGFRHVEVIDDDLGLSASGTVARPGFERLVAWLCAGDVGAVLCFDASRLARNGRDWHHLLELCGLVDARVIDQDGVYNPCSPNDRLLLGMKGTISEFELGVLRARMLDAARDKAGRGELRISVPIGYTWHRDAGLGFDPDVRVQDAVHRIFSRFRELRSGRQVLLSLTEDKLCFPRPTDGHSLTSFDWTPVRYRKTYGHGKPRDEWDVFLKEHHEGYIEWEEYERNQALLAANAYGRKGGAKSGRGGRALLSGLLSCGRCGRRLCVAYTGKTPRPVYRCDRPNIMLGLKRCLGVGGPRIDKTIAEELLRVVQPMAIEAAMKAEHRQKEAQADRRRAAELDVEKAKYEATLAERRYAACDPDNRLIAATLEKHWEAALKHLEVCKKRLDNEARPSPRLEKPPKFNDLADDLQTAWDAPGVSTRTRQRLVRALIKDIVVDVDEAARDVVLTIHWQGGQHSQVRVRKPKSGEHGCTTSEEALKIMRSMAGRWSDSDIAATLNRMGVRTGFGKTWTAHRVASIRRVNDINAYASAEKDGEWLTMTEAATKLGVTNHVIRRLIKDNVLPAEQVVPRAPYQIKAVDLDREYIMDAINNRRRKRPYQDSAQIPLSINSDT